MEKTFGHDHPDVGLSLNNMANLLFRQVKTMEEHPRNGVISFDVYKSASTKCPLSAQSKTNGLDIYIIYIRWSSVIRIAGCGKVNQ